MITLPDKKGEPKAYPQSDVAWRLRQLQLRHETRDKNFDEFCHKHFPVKS